MSEGVSLAVCVLHLREGADRVCRQFRANLVAFLAVVVDEWDRGLGVRVVAVVTVQCLSVVN